MITNLQGSNTLFINWKQWKGDSIYSSFVCWLIIGTKDGAVYVIDAIKLRSNLRQPKGLGRSLEKEFLSNSKILKVLPNDAEVIALQRDFGIKLTNILPV
jgi:hypothetical protein